MISTQYSWVIWSASGLLFDSRHWCWQWNSKKGKDSPELKNSSLLFFFFRTLNPQLANAKKSWLHHQISVLGHLSKCCLTWVNFPRSNCIFSPMLSRMFTLDVVLLRNTLPRVMFDVQQRGRNDSKTCVSLGNLSDFLRLFGAKPLNWHQSSVINPCSHGNFMLFLGLRVELYNRHLHIHVWTKRDEDAQSVYHQPWALIQ